MSRDIKEYFHVEGPMTLQQVTLQTGLTEDTLRYYEKIGLLPRIERDESSKQRRYSVDNIYIAHTLAALRATGMSLKDMKKYLDNDLSTTELIAKQVELLDTQKLIVKQKIITLNHQLKYLEKKTDYYEASSKGDEEEIYRIEVELVGLAKKLTMNLKTLTKEKE